jgi:hypothetical protein
MARGLGRQWHGDGAGGTAVLPLELDVDVARVVEQIRSYKPAMTTPVTCAIYPKTRSFLQRREARKKMTSGSPYLPEGES